MGEEYENELSHERRRRGIFVENQTQEILAPSGATSSGRICRPAGLEMKWIFISSNMSRRRRWTGRQKRQLDRYLTHA
jgi:hypothetical protein